MFQCEICGRMYLSQREADLCTPREEWDLVYGPQPRTIGEAFMMLEEGF